MNWHHSSPTSNNQSNTLPYPRRPKALLTSSKDSPCTFKAALSTPQVDIWRKAINKELSTMENYVWDFVEINPSPKLVVTKWVFKTKKDRNRIVTEHKAHVCA
ncbi:hypothetical protein O181_093633 [Austropuccinia psidii MF-1]|uniref:Reverse transcriptase Ty1/copia-type domain-containing protein n=1 Tax=Austropuccinia psidii MF-1 TaxID=1389203 RepID=A0A9Q3J1L4_9BASI|nr:hypothetical protein [Austropuccinia psidii MF-1]